MNGLYIYEKKKIIIIKKACIAKTFVTALLCLICVYFIEPFFGHFRYLMHSYYNISVVISATAAVSAVTRFLLKITF